MTKLRTVTVCDDYSFFRTATVDNKYIVHANSSCVDLELLAASGKYVHVNHLSLLQYDGTLVKQWKGVVMGGHSTLACTIVDQVLHTYTVVEKQIIHSQHDMLTDKVHDEVPITICAERDPVKDITLCHKLLVCNNVPMYIACTYLNKVYTHDTSVFTLRTLGGQLLRHIDDARYVYIAGTYDDIFILALPYADKTVLEYYQVRGELDIKLVDSKEVVPLNKSAFAHLYVHRDEFMLQHGERGVLLKTDFKDNKESEIKFLHVVNDCAINRDGVVYIYTHPQEYEDEEGDDDDDESTD